MAKLSTLIFCGLVISVFSRAHSTEPVDGRKFRRQHSVKQYVLDFYCPSERLAIELDGEHHFTASGLLYDEERTAHLNALKINVLRFENEEIFQSPEAVLAEIKKHFLHH